MHYLCKFLYVYMHVCFVITEDAVRILTALFFIMNGSTSLQVRTQSLLFRPVLTLPSPVVYDCMRE